VHDRGALVWRLRVQLERELLVVIEALIHALGGDAGDLGHACRATECLQVLVENLIGCRLARRLDEDLVRLDDGGVAVLDVQVRDHLGTIRAAMA
jgi:hypothetical protein